MQYQMCSVYEVRNTTEIQRAMKEIFAERKH